MTGHEPRPRRGRASSGGRGDLVAGTLRGRPGPDALSSVSSRIAQWSHRSPRRSPDLRSGRPAVHFPIRAAGGPDSAANAAQIRSRGQRSNEFGERLVEVAEQRDPGRAQDGVVEHAVGRARRRARRIELGGGDRADDGRVVPGSHRQRPGRTRTTCTAPWLVTWWTPLRRSSAKRRSIGARSAVNVGQPRWSSTNASRPGVSVAIGQQAQDRAHHVGAVLAAHPRRPDHRRRAAEDERLALARQLRLPVDAQAGSGGRTRDTAGRVGRRTRSRWRRARGGRRLRRTPRRPSAPPGR